MRRLMIQCGMLLVWGMAMAQPVPGPAGVAPKPTSTLTATPQTPPARLPDIGYAPTPHEAVAKLLALANLRPGDRVYDLGCGDGRIVVAAARQFGVQAVGIDLDPERVRESRENARTNHVSGLVAIVEGDFFKVDLSPATVITLYVGTELNRRLMPRLSQLRPGTRILSFDHPLPGAKPVETVCGTRIEDGHEYTIYKWIVPWERE